MGQTDVKPATRRSPGEGSGAPRRQAILEAALRLIGTRGLGSVTHRAVAAEAGVPLAATTYYFASKDDMVAEAFGLAASREREAIELAAAQLGDGVLDAGRWATALADWIAPQAVGEARIMLLAQFELQLQSAHRDDLRDVWRTWRQANLAHAERLLGAAGSPQPAADARLLVAAVQGLRIAQLASGGEIDAALVRETLARLIDALLTGSR